MPQSKQAMAVLWHVLQYIFQSCVHVLQQNSFAIHTQVRLRFPSSQSGSLFCFALCAYLWNLWNFRFRCRGVSQLFKKALVSSIGSKRTLRLEESLRSLNRWGRPSIVGIARDSNTGNQSSMRCSRPAKRSTHALLCHATTKLSSPPSAKSHMDSTYFLISLPPHFTFCKIPHCPALLESSKGCWISEEFGEVCVQQLPLPCL